MFGERKANTSSMVSPRNHLIAASFVATRSFVKQERVSSSSLPQTSSQNCPLPRWIITAQRLGVFAPIKCAFPLNAEKPAFRKCSRHPCCPGSNGVSHPGDHHWQSSDSSITHSSRVSLSESLSRHVGIPNAQSSLPRCHQGTSPLSPQVFALQHPTHPEVSWSCIR